MKTLYLIRHAKSSWKNQNLADHERPLNKWGKRDAPFMVKLLREEDVKPDLIISSPAVRALITAKTFAEGLDYPKNEIEINDSIYEAGVSDLLNVIYNISDKYRYVMLFGHNPGLTILNNYITDQDIDNIVTCGIVCIQFNIDSWKNVNDNSGKILSYEFPKKYLK